MSVRVHGKRVVPQNHTLYLNRLGISSVREIKGLEELRDLISLELDGNQIQTLEGLECCISLQKLSLRNNLIRDIKGFDTLENLQYLNLAQNHICRIEGLKSLEKLEKINLRNNIIEDIEGLETLANLRTLDIGHNAITQICNLDILQSLLTLDLSGNKIMRIEGLSSLGNLDNFDLSDNLLSTISGLESLTDLQYLNLSHNQIPRIQGLNMLEELRELYLSHNLLSCIEGLDALKNLQKLSLGNNKIAQVEGLDNLIHLGELYLQNNQITRAKGFGFLPALKILHIAQNPLEDWPSDLDVNDARACANQFRSLEPLIASLRQKGYGDLIKHEILEAQFPFLENDIKLVIKIQLRSGKQQFLMQKLNSKTKEVELEEVVDCIHLVVSDSHRTLIKNHSLGQENPNIRSSESLYEVQVEIEEKFLAFKSWVTGLTEAGVKAFQLQSSIDSMANVEYPLTGRLLRFAARANPKFLPRYIEYIKEESLYEGKPHEAFLIANLEPILGILVEKQESIPKLKQLLKNINELNLPASLQPKLNELLANTSKRKFWETFLTK
ncbi:MAG: leucine-rich protein [Promethearchaeota archaeon CR_4]|nr:MAG: leucine-rich protein [Candidatus Lokiarchaeota archaeon CR_4]